MFSPNDYGEMAKVLLQMFGVRVAIFLIGFGLGAWIF